MNDQPNILLITADQLRFDCLGCYNNPVIRTPNIDALAENGMRFNNAFAAATVCVPSRQSILTGQYPSKHGAKGNGSAIPEQTATFVSSLRDAGYQTAALGKMHFYPPYADYGFDVMWLAEQHGPGRDMDDYHAYLEALGLVDLWDEWDQVEEKRKTAPDHYWEAYGAQVSDIPEEHYHSTWIADRTLEFINARDTERPFFAWMSFIKPHHPFDPPAPFDQKYDPEDINLPEPQTGWEQKPLLVSHGDPRQTFFDTRDMAEADLRRIATLYYGSIEHIDVQVGRVLDNLKEAGLIENTLIVFTSDHGDYLGQYGMFLKKPNMPYDALAKVPLLISGAGVSRSAQTDALVSLVDLAPTFTQIAGADTLRGVQGDNLSEILSGENNDTEHEAIFCESEFDLLGVITRSHKSIYDPHRKITEVYDRRTDTLEENNIADQAAPLITHHQDLLRDWLIDCAYDRYAGAIRSFARKPKNE